MLIPDLTPLSTVAELSLVAAGVAAAGLWLYRRTTRELHAQREAVQRQSQALQAMFDASPVAMMFSSGTQVRYANPAFTRLLGYRPGDEAPNFYVDEPLRQRVREALARGELVPEHEVRLRARDGGVRTCLSTVMPWGFDGESGIMGWAVDITARKQQETELQQALQQAQAGNLRLQDFADVSADRFWETDHEFRMVGLWARGGVSEAFRRQRMGRRPWEVLPPSSEFERTQMARFRQMIDARETFVNFEYQQTTAEGQPEWVSLSGKPVFDAQGQFVGYRGCTTNIEERKRREAALEQARREAHHANRAKSMFLATMSHEIRTPMNGIVGMTSLALEGELSAEQRQHLSVVQQSAESLLSIINDVLDLSKIEANQMELECVPFDLRKVIDGVLGMLRFHASSKGLTLSAEVADAVPALVAGDPTRLRQVLINLVGNAIKFTAQGLVTVRVTCDTAGDAPAPNTVPLRVEVQDTGVGIAEDKREAIFLPFTQADGSTTRHYGGSGLGLTICRKLVELMGGHIGVDSTPGVGSTFHFSVRLAPAQGSEQTAAAPVPTVQRSLNVLLVEDHPINQMLATRMLGRAGHTVHVAASGVDGVAQWRALRPDVVLMDVQMPLMDGLEATRQIRSAEAAEGLARTPIIAMTANAFAEDRQACLQAGMDAYLTKPVKAELIQRTLDEQVPPR